LYRLATTKPLPTVSLTHLVTSSAGRVALDIRTPSNGDRGVIWSRRNRRAISGNTLHLWKVAMTPTMVRP
jgi:hypothetical protein